MEDVRKARAVQRYFDHADVDHDERLSWEEFVASVEAVHIEITALRLTASTSGVELPSRFPRPTRRAGERW